MINYKPGGGNKPQPYVPAGNGEKSGEYANKTNKNFPIKSSYLVYNPYNSKLVRKVYHYSVCPLQEKPPLISKPNSVIKKVHNNCIVTERYYNENGETYLDIDYTDHGNPKTHPFVPHIHKWIKDKNGVLTRQKMEEFR